MWSVKLACIQAKRSGSPCWAIIGSSTLGEVTSSVARNTSTIGRPSQLPTTPSVRIAAAIAIHASPSVITSIRTGAKTSVMRHTRGLSKRTATAGPETLYQMSALLIYATGWLHFKGNPGMMQP